MLRSVASHRPSPRTRTPAAMMSIAVALASPAAVASLAASLTLAAAPALAQQPDWSATRYSPRTNYVLRCSGCHGLHGAGASKGGVPDLRGFVGAFLGDEDGRTYVVRVPGVRSANLDAEATAAVLNFVVDSFAGASRLPDAAPFTAAEVAARQTIPVTDVVGLRRTVAARLKAAGHPVADYPWP